MASPIILLFEMKQKGANNKLMIMAQQQRQQPNNSHCYLQ